MSAIAFVVVMRLIPMEAGSDRKPYFILNDTQLPYSAIDQVVEASKLDAKRSVRIAHECGARAITNRPPSVDSRAVITVEAGFDQRRVTDCIQSHAAKGEVEFRYVWLTNREKIF